MPNSLERRKVAQHLGWLLLERSRAVIRNSNHASNYCAVARANHCLPATLKHIRRIWSHTSFKYMYFTIPAHFIHTCIWVHTKNNCAFYIDVDVFWRLWKYPYMLMRYCDAPRLQHQHTSCGAILQVWRPWNPSNWHDQYRSIIWYM